MYACARYLQTQILHPAGAPKTIGREPTERHRSLRVRYTSSTNSIRIGCSRIDFADQPRDGARELSELVLLGYEISVSI